MSKKSVTLSVLALISFVFLSCEGPGASIANDGSPAEGRTILPTPTSTSAFLQNYADTRVIAGYKAEVKYYNASMGYQDLVLHYGFNNWQDVKEVPMTLIPRDIDVSATIDVPLWATSLEYVVYVRRADGTTVWDNNGENDYRVPVHQAGVNVTVIGTSRTITFITPLDSAVLHYGVNGWKNISEIGMELDTHTLAVKGVKQYKATLSNLASTDALDFCFRTNEWEWVNNKGANWFHKPGTALIDVWPTDYQSEIYYMEILGMPVKNYVNGANRTTADLGLYHSGLYFCATFGSAPYGDHTFVLDVIKDGYRYYGTATQRVVSYSNNVALKITKTAVK